MANVLIIDDESYMSDMLSEVVSAMGHSVTTSSTLGEGLKAAANKPYDVILLDVRLPDGDGTEKLPTFKSLPSSPEVIIITAFDSRNGAEFALNNGAWDYISKTASLSEIRLTLSRAIQYKGQRMNYIDIPRDLKLEGLLWKSDRMAVCISHLSQAVKSDVNVLITGETGTGKELFARAIHDNSKRAAMSFVTVDCAALPPTLAESLLFGHEKGAFTSADKSVEGLVKQADGGTLFLDEVGELPLVVQKSFLRVLQERRFRPLGAKREVESNFRVVAATNRNIDEMIAAGKFRQDLLHRIQTIHIQIPSLRKRTDDVIELMLHYVKIICRRYDMNPKSFSPEFLETVAAYEWPGNVRELINTLEWTIATAGAESTLYPKHLPVKLRLKSTYRDQEEAVLPEAAALPTLKTARDSAVMETELKYLRRLMDVAKDDFKEACRISGLSSPQLYNLMRKHHITR
ncbi:MAG: Transcriptional regulatory protein QseF [Syntrophus sp. SKADARSKE-3]|nr:Transcriptional regulatory protein QseF [Syntrophus sp. SKADARSKE-3]